VEQLIITSDVFSSLSEAPVCAECRCASYYRSPFWRKPTWDPANTGARWAIIGITVVQTGKAIPRRNTAGTRSFFPGFGLASPLSRTSSIPGTSSRWSGSQRSIARPWGPTVPELTSGTNRPNTATAITSATSGKSVVTMCAWNTRRAKMRNRR